MFRSLWKKLLALFLGVFFCAAAFFLSFSYRKNQEAMVREFYLRGEYLMRVLSSQAAPLYQGRDVEKLILLFDTFATSEAVLAIIAYDGSGAIWLESSAIPLSEDERRLSKKGSGRRDFTTAEGMVVTEFVTPVRLPTDPVPLGWFRLVMDRSPFRRELRELFRDTLLFGGAIIGIATLLFILLLRRFLRTIPLLVAATRDMASGDFRTTVPIRSRDELGRLAGAFNEMAHRLHATTVSRDLLLREIEERKKLEAQLLQAQKMESIGRLTGGVAHDFNNLLGVIIGNCELTLQSVKADDPVREYLLDVKEAGNRAATLTRQLLAFSRRQVLKAKVFNLNLVLRRADRLLRRLVGDDVELLVLPAGDLGLVKADLHQVEQVIFNLAVNARDAMPRGGKLTMETGNVVLDQPYADQHPEVTAGPYVMLAVSDTGIGMDAETLSRIFEPFFTTKKKRGGTGLGLSMVYGIMKQSGGHVSVYSEPGKGTSVKIYLPRTEEDSDSVSSLPEEPFVASVTGSETVLVVEDEGKLRALIGRILREKGYTIVEAASGAEAVQRSASHEGPIALVITDVILPGMSGRETAEQLAVQRPTMKVLYISGYTANSIVHRGVLAEGTHFLQKPFTPDALARKVREVLDGVAK